MSKSTMRPMNSSKNKLNSEIILSFNPNPNAVCIWDELNFSILFMSLTALFDIFRGSHCTIQLIF